MQLQLLACFCPGAGAVAIAAVWRSGILEADRSVCTGWLDCRKYPSGVGEYRGTFTGDPLRVLPELCEDGICGEEVERIDASDSACKGDADSEYELTPDVLDESTPLIEVGVTATMPCWVSKLCTVTGL